MRIDRILYTILLVALPLFAMADGPVRGGDNRGPRFSPEEYRQRCQQFVEREAKLTPSESQKLFPIYHQMKEEQRKLFDEQHRLRREASKGDLSDKRSLEILNRINVLSQKIVQLEIDYQKKFLKIVSASKLLRVNQAEQRFQRKMLHNMVNDKRDKKPKR